MARQIHDFDPPDRFVAGTVGVPGERAFYLQAIGGGRAVTLGVEKAQVAVLAERLTDMLRRLARRGLTVPMASEGPQDVAPLDTPIEEEFRVGALALAWDADATRVIVEAQAPSSTGVSVAFTDDDAGPDALRVHLSVPATVAFVARAQRVVGAGREPCPLCGLPLDPTGHVCPRQNGRHH